MGTPIVIGVNKGLDGRDQSDFAAQGWQWEQFIQLITSEVATIHGIIGSFMPVLMAVMLTRFLAPTNLARRVTNLPPYSRASLYHSYVFTGIVLGPEFPSLIGGFELGSGCYCS